MVESDQKEYPKRPRVKDFLYKGQYAYFITICTNLKKSVFVSKEAFELVYGYLLDTSKEFNFGIYAYCFMPDHLHLLLVAEDETADLNGFIKTFKQKSAFYFKKEFGEKLWQPSFYDHVLRKRESLNKIAEYIFYNPVRKGLVEDYRDYQYLGTLMFEM
ncbi:MAG: transposase [bacterium]